MQQVEHVAEAEAPGEARDLSLGVLGLAAVMAAVERPAPRRAPGPPAPDAEPAAAQPRT
ncbi:hypothetical protein COUCH_18550 [Couchioplanes caeruleus]|uniref:hypothetical protein n=1 Tax=Couchioplanes caeruleus TaxID=56438 RepID=UPI0020C07E2A|nr:hypothetical protein [Couchioplanes caeruleus]UQU68155.1 hypothetical protein COUCH_18550 [Couchioplanes caeruleus]